MSPRFYRHRVQVCDLRAGEVAASLVFLSFRGKTPSEGLFLNACMHTRAPVYLCTPKHEYIYAHSSHKKEERKLYW